RIYRRGLQETHRDFGDGGLRTSAQGNDRGVPQHRWQSEFDGIVRSNTCGAGAHCPDAKIETPPGRTGGLEQFQKNRSHRPKSVDFRVTPPPRYLSGYEMSEMFQMDSGISFGVA